MQSVREWQCEFAIMNGGAQQRTQRYTCMYILVQWRLVQSVHQRACLLAGAFSLIHPSIYRVGWWHIYTLYEVCIAGPNPPSAAAAVAVAANI